MIPWWDKGPIQNSLDFVLGEQRPDDPKVAWFLSLGYYGTFLDTGISKQAAREQLHVDKHMSSLKCPIALVVNNEFQSLG
jgi:hypothetical protein